MTHLRKKTSQSSLETSSGPAGDVYKTKIIVLGDHGVGKSAFVNSYLKGDVMETMIRRRSGSFLEPDSHNRTKKIKYGSWNVEVLLQDTAGQERYRSLTTSYYRGANGCLVFFNVHNKASFDNLSSWLDDINRYCLQENISIVLVGVTNEMSENNPTGHYLSPGHINNTARDGIYSSYSRKNNNSNNINHNRSSNNNNPLAPKNSSRFGGQNGHLQLQEIIPSSVSKSDESHAHSNGSVAHYTDDDDDDICNNRIRNETTTTTVRQRIVHKNTTRAKNNNSDKIPNSKINCSNNNNTINNNNNNNTHSLTPDYLLSENIAENDDDMGDEVASRVITKEQARNFAHYKEIPYREVDLENNYSSVENVMNRLFDAIIKNNRRGSILPDCGVNQTIQLSNPVPKKQGFVKTCCPC